jgi:hypothetical protein
MGGSRIVYVPPPNGTEDTTNLQAALDVCVTYGKNCTVQLAAGTYLTRQLVAYNFQGSFKGMGIGATTIEAIHRLPVNIPDVFLNGECPPNTSSCLWPSLVIFVDGNISVSDLAIRITADPGQATTGWMIAGGELTDLIDAIRFQGQNVNAIVDDVSIEARTDNTSTSSGYNLINGVIFVGEQPRSSQPWDYYVLSGSLEVRNSSFSTMDDGVAGGQLTSSRIKIGGSRSNGNTFDNVFTGMDLESAEKSDFEISYNTSTGTVAAMWAVQYHPWHPFLPSKPSRFSIHDNMFIGTGYGASGMFFADDPTNPWIQATTWNNTIELQNNLMEGIGAYSTKGTLILNNTVTGSEGRDAIGLWNSSNDTAVGNNVSGFTVDPTGYAQIYLDPSTNHDLVVCADRSDAVLNQGTNNFVIGCQQLASTEGTAKSTYPATSIPRPGLPKGKP